MNPARFRTHLRLARMRRRSPAIARAIQVVRRDRLTYLSTGALLDLAVQASAPVPGALVEAGTALGGSAIVLTAAKPPDRPLHVFDAFGMIPPPSERDDTDVHERYDTIKSGRSSGIGGDLYYGYRPDLLQEVRTAFTRHGYEPGRNNVTLVPGLFEDTVTTIGEPVALAHLDGDWYDSTMTCLQAIDPWLTVGGRFVIDDYDAWSGARRAVDDFLDGRIDYRRERHTRLHLVKLDRRL